MKKIFIFALFVLGMYSAPVFAMAQEIILIELNSIAPLDDAKDDAAGGRPEPNRITATIDGDQLSIDVGADAPGYAEVIDPETGEVVVDEEFEGATTMSIPNEGNYEVYIYTESGSVMMGELEVE